MNILALSGSPRAASTNTALLRALATVVAPRHTVDVFDEIAALPVFSPDKEGVHLPRSVAEFAARVVACDGLVIACPEYVHALPGGLKNAIDWLVSREELIGKPIAILHGSHRGDDMLAQLRLVLSTVSSEFRADIFQRFDLLKYSPAEIETYFEAPGPRATLEGFLADFTDSISA